MPLPSPCRNMTLNTILVRFRVLNLFNVVTVHCHRLQPLCFKCCLKSSSGLFMVAELV